MKRKMKPGSGVWQYLQQSGVLDNGTPDEIAAARASYWKLVRKQWKQAKRITVSVMLTHDEERTIRLAAFKHHRTIATFLKEAAFSYIEKGFVIPDTHSLEEIRLLLAKNFLSLQKNLEENRGAVGMDPSILNRIEDLEKKVLEHLEHPKSIEQAIRAQVLQQPQYKAFLQQLLQSL